MDGTRAGGTVPEDLRAELERLIAADTTRLGQVYRADRRGLSADAIATELGVSTRGFVWNYRAIRDAILDGAVPASPHIARQAAGRCRALRSASPVSNELRRYLVTLESRLDQHGQTVRASRDAERAAEPSHPLVRAGARHDVPVSPLVVAIRRRLDAIDAALPADVLEYRGLLAVGDIEGAFERLLRNGPAGSAFRELVAAGRLDLTLEQLAVQLEDHVPTRVRATARERLDYYRDRGAHR